MSWIVKRVVSPFSSGQIQTTTKVRKQLPSMVEAILTVIAGVIAVINFHIVVAKASDSVGVCTICVRLSLQNKIVTCT